MTDPRQLSRRERQIMDILYRHPQANAKEVMEHMDNAPSYSSVRTLLRKLVEKGHVGIKESGLKYLYYPLIDKNRASRSALSSMMKTFFDDSPFEVVNSLLDSTGEELTNEELERLESLIKAKKSSRKE